MKALLLAAGEGTRLRPLTENIPKCLVPINGQPLLSIWLDQLSEAGVTEFLINTSYLAEQVNDFISESPHKDKVTLVYEQDLLGTAGTLINNIDWLDEDSFLFAHADNLCNVNWPEFFQAHKNRPKQTALSMMTFDTDRPQSCGIVTIDQEGVLSGFFEKVEEPPGIKANAAIYLVEPGFVKSIAEHNKNSFDFSVDIIPNFLPQINTWHHDGYLRDIGTPESYRLAQDEWLKIHQN